ncbi:MAG: CRS1 / YhbY (CRM) domain protein [Methanoregulaceae archaeon PtaB.Bin056]|jgi:RNA-binding protein|nr:MAG: CRS1 / YhbY (CRM) domain protein [Methanoregulaceae archaeon PtaB.Bin056]
MKEDRVGSGMQEMKATVWIGKQGLTPTVVEELVQQLKKRHHVKVKWLRNADVDPEELARSAGAVLLEVRGRTAVFTERKSL